MGATEPQASLEAIAAHALQFVSEGAVVGLGSGRAAAAFVRALGERVRNGMRVTGVATSEATAALAQRCGIPLVRMQDIDAIDVTLDGADEVDPHLDLIKGYGGALLREKIVASASRQTIILVGSEKLVPVLGTLGVLPVEVLPFALSHCRRLLEALGLRPLLRTSGTEPFVTDSGNYIVDCRVQPMHEPQVLDASVLEIAGVIDTGLFLGIAERVLVGSVDSVRELVRKA